MSACDGNTAVFNSVARVMCKQMGHAYGTAHFMKIFGDGPDVVWLSKISCIGDEDSLANCTTGSWGFNYNIRDCDDTLDVNILCSYVSKYNLF